MPPELALPSEGSEDLEITIRARRASPAPVSCLVHAPLTDPDTMPRQGESLGPTQRGSKRCGQKSVHENLFQEPTWQEVHSTGGGPTWGDLQKALEGQGRGPEAPHHTHAKSH